MTTSLDRFDMHPSNRTMVEHVRVLMQDGRWAKLLDNEFFAATLEELRDAWIQLRKVIHMDCSQVDTHHVADE
jgi:hypothetical protein